MLSNVLPVLHFIARVKRKDCVCVRERERQKDRQTDRRERERQRESEWWEKTSGLLGDPSNRANREKEKNAREEMSNEINNF